MKTESRVDVSRAATITLAVVVILGWLGLALWAAAFCLIMGVLSVGTFFGEPATGSYWVEAVVWSIAGAVSAAAGPLGVWLFHRRRAWLVSAGFAAVVTAVIALYLLLSFDAV